MLKSLVSRAAFVLSTLVFLFVLAYARVFDGSVQTDKLDYYPGEVVHITGAGWTPGETVDLHIESSCGCWDGSWDSSSVADDLGNIANDGFVVQDEHLGVAFILTAYGETSGQIATWAFTDSPKIGSVSVGAQSPNPVLQGSSASYTITISRGSGSGSSGSVSCAMSVTSALPAGVIASFSPSSPTMGSSSSSTTTTLTLSTTGATPIGSTGFTVRATAGNPGDFAEGSGTLVVAASNTAPTLTAIANKLVDELSLLQFSVSASDADAGQTLTYSLDPGAPAGASITAGGQFNWTPTEGQGPGDYPVTVRVTDNGSPNLSDTKSFSIHVNEVNAAPVLDPVGDKLVDEGSLLTFTATAADPDEPANTKTFTLDAGAPAGASIDPSSGVFTWTPTEAQGPGDFSVTVRVTDNGAPTMSDFETINVHVNEVNQAPTLSQPANGTVDEETLISRSLSATDSDEPAQTLTFSLVSGPGSVSGSSWTWTPGEADGPGMFVVVVKVSDGTLEDQKSFNVTVDEVNKAPTLTLPALSASIDEGMAWSWSASATDPDLPAQTLSYSLIGAPAGASISPTTGAFTWTPAEGQGPGDYTFKVRVTDNGGTDDPVRGDLSDEESVTVHVNEVNEAPSLDPIGPKTVDEESLLSFTALASDNDLPANTLTFSLDAGAPTGASIDPSSGLFSWTPTEDQGPGDYSITVRVTDNGSPPMSSAKTFSVHVNEVNKAPTLTLPSLPASIDEEVQWSWSASSTDPDLPGQTLTYALVGAPAGASIDPMSGAFTWTPGESQGPGDYTFKVRVTDNGGADDPVRGDLSDEKSVTVHVNEVNKKPSLSLPSLPANIDEEVAWTWNASATDLDYPVQTLSYSLVDAPVGATINPASGAFSWTPAEDQGPGDYTFKVRVTDNGSTYDPVNGDLSDEQTVTVHVDEVNKKPTLDPISDKTVDEETLLTFTATASDPDLPANTLTFSLQPGTDPVPAGATIGGSTGVFTWTPSEAQGPGTYKFKVRVTDNGSPAMYDELEITFTVKEVNKAPELDAISDKAVDEDTLLSFTATASDPDVLHGQTPDHNKLTFSLQPGTDPVPAGATIDPDTGLFTWTPNDPQSPGTYKFKVRVTDDGSPAMYDEQEITVKVAEVPDAPSVDSVSNDNQVVDYSDEIQTIVITAHDPDNNPGQLSLVNVPLGLSVVKSPLSGGNDGDTVTFTVSGKVDAMAGVYQIRVTDDGSTAPDSLPRTSTGYGQLTVDWEDALPTYVGDTYVVTGGPTVTTAPVKLSAHVDQGPETPLAPGDITRATVSFLIYDLANNLLRVVNAPVDVNGNAVANVVLSGGNSNDPCQVYTVVTKISTMAFPTAGDGSTPTENRYWKSVICDTSTVTVCLGTTDQRTTGGGWIPEVLSRNGKCNFGFTVAPGKKGIKGQSVFVIRGSDGYDYVVKSNSWNGGGLGFSGLNLASFNGKCTITAIDQTTGLIDVTRSQGNCSFTVDVKDGDLASPKVTDEYGIRVLRGDGSVFYQTLTSGSYARRVMGGGNVMVKSK